MHFPKFPLTAPLVCAAALLALAAGPAALQAQEKPVPPSAPPPVTGLATDIARRANLEARIMWMDATANLQRLSTREGVSDIFEKCKKAGINTIVVDVKPLSGHVLYNSKVAPRLKEWRGFQYPEGYDLLFTAMIEGRRRGLKVYASVNTFSEGHKLIKSGPLYEKPDQQAIVYDVQRTITAPDAASFTLTVGENRGPEADQIALYTPDAPDLKRLGPNDAAAVINGETVSAVIDGGLVEQGGLAAPSGGHLLVGRGTGAAWLLEHLKVGDALTYKAKEVFLPILEAPSEVVGGFVNPANPESRAYMLKVVEELADNYALDGIVFDRMRYSSLKTDFSPLSRELFETWLGQKLDNFPQDIYAYDPVPGRPLVQGPYYKQWLEWRARNITDWLSQAAEAAQRRRPGIQLGVYVGSWYDKYYGVGVNWGASDFAAGYDWMTPSYPATGYAGKLNWITTGCYYQVATREDARQLQLPEDRTVEAAADLSVRAVNDATFTYAGLQVLDYKGKPEDFRKALQTALQRSQGVMLFDLVYIEEYDWWNLLSEVLTGSRRAPHDVPGLQGALQQARKVLKTLPAGG